MVFRGEYRGFVIWQESPRAPVFVQDLSNEWTQCSGLHFESITKAEEYIDFVIEHYRLNKPPKSAEA